MSPNTCSPSIWSKQREKGWGKSDSRFISLGMEWVRAESLSPSGPVKTRPPSPSEMGQDRHKCCKLIPLLSTLLENRCVLNSPQFRLSIPDPSSQRYAMKGREVNCYSSRKRSDRAEGLPLPAPLKRDHLPHRRWGRTGNRKPTLQLPPRGN